MTLQEFRDYLVEMAVKADKVGDRFPLSGADNLAAQMWKTFTPQALSLWTTPGVLEHVAACLTTQPEEYEEEEEDETTP